MLASVTGPGGSLSTPLAPWLGSANFSFLLCPRAPSVLASVFLNLSRGKETAGEGLPQTNLQTRIFSAEILCAPWSNPTRDAPHTPRLLWEAQGEHPWLGV